MLLFIHNYIGHGKTNALDLELLSEKQSSVTGLE